MVFVNPEWYRPRIMGWNNNWQVPEPLYVGWRKPRLYREDDLWQCSLTVTTAIGHAPMQIIGTGITRAQAWYRMVVTLHATGGILP